MTIKSSTKDEAESMPPDAASAVLGLTRSMIRTLWAKSSSAGGCPLPIVQSASISCLKPGREAVVFAFPGERHAKLKEAKGFDVRICLGDDGSTLLRIENSSVQDEELFAYVVLDLLEIAAKFEAEAAGARFHLLIDRLKAWRLFMKDRYRRLSASRETGLAGELFFLKCCLERGVEITSLQSFWTGSMHGARDFSFGDETFAEVKTSSAALPLRVKIDSLEQLDAGTAKTLLLCAVVMQSADPETESGKTSETPDEFRTLAQMADDVEAQLHAESMKEEFRTLLFMAGLNDEQKAASRRRFRPEAIHFFEADRLPTLTPGKIPGIVKASYEIELLDAAGKFPYGHEAAILDENAAWGRLCASGGADFAPDDEDELNNSEDDFQ